MSPNTLLRLAAEAAKRSLFGRLIDFNVIAGYSTPYSNRPADKSIGTQDHEDQDASRTLRWLSGVFQEIHNNQPSGKNYQPRVHERAPILRHIRHKRWIRPRDLPNVDRFSRPHAHDQASPMCRHSPTTLMDNS